MEKCLVDFLISGQEQNPEFYTPEHVREHVDLFIFAGHDTSAMALTVALFFIAFYPEIQTKVHDEIDSIIPDVEDMTMSQINNLTYLDAIIKETLRYAPSAPFVGRSIDQEIKIGNYVLPVGCSVFLNLFQLHRDPEQFREPDQFNPDRFSSNSEENQNRHPFAFQPFASGPRNCIGQKFALQEIKIFLVTILSHFDIESNTTIDKLTFYQSLTLMLCNMIDMTFEVR